MKKERRPKRLTREIDGIRISLRVLADKVPPGDVGRAWEIVMDRAVQPWTWFCLKATRRGEHEDRVRLRNALRARAYTAGYSKGHLRITITPTTRMVAFMWGDRICPAEVESAKNYRRRLRRLRLGGVPTLPVNNQGNQHS